MREFIKVVGKTDFYFATCILGKSIILQLCHHLVIDLLIASFSLTYDARSC